MLMLYESVHKGLLNNYDVVDGFVFFFVINH